MLCLWLNVLNAPRDGGRGVHIKLPLSLDTAPIVDLLEDALDLEALLTPSCREAIRRRMTQGKRAGQWSFAQACDVAELARPLLSSLRGLQLSVRVNEGKGARRSRVRVHMQAL